jgi:hypothetical protein
MLIIDLLETFVNKLLERQAITIVKTITDENYPFVEKTFIKNICSIEGS